MKLMSKAICIYLPDELVEELDRFCAAMQVSRSWAVRQVLIGWIREHSASVAASHAGAEPAPDTRPPSFATERPVFEKGA